MYHCIWMCCREKEGSESSTSTPRHKTTSCTRGEIIHENNSNTVDTDNNQPTTDTTATVNANCTAKNFDANIKNTTELNRTVENSSAPNENETHEEQNKNLDTNYINNNFIMGNKSSTNQGSCLQTPTDNSQTRARTDGATNNEIRAWLDEAPTTLTGGDDVPLAVGPRMELGEYARREWQGNTSRALIMRQVRLYTCCSYV